MLKKRSNERKFFDNKSNPVKIQATAVKPAMTQAESMRTFLLFLLVQFDLRNSAIWDAKKILLADWKP